VKIVKFKKLGLENFGCYQNKIELEIEDGKMVIICGPNGIGKTTIFDSISFSLYGVTSKGLKAKDVVNNKTKKNCHTYLEFSIDQENYRIDRYYSHVKYRNTAIMTRDNIPYKKGPAEVNNEINKILMPLKLFNNSIMFGQKVKTFFTDLNDTDQKEIFRKILRLDDYIRYHKQTVELIKEIDKTISDNNNSIIINTNMIESYKCEIELLLKEKQDSEKTKVNKIYEYNEQIKLINQRLESFKCESSQYENSENELKITDGTLNEYRTQLKELEIQFKNIVEQIQAKAKNKQLEISNKSSQMESEEINKFNVTLNELNSEINKLDSDFQNKWSEWDKERAVAYSEIELLKSSIKNIEDEKQKFTDSVINVDISICPTCHQKIDGKTIDDLKDYIKLLNDKINKNINEIEDKKLIINIVINKINKFKPIYEKTKLELCDKKQEANEKRRNNINQIKRRLNNALIKLKEMIMTKVKDETENIRNEKIEINNFINELEKQYKNIEDGYIKYIKLKNSITDFEFQIRKYNELIKIKEDEKFDYSRILLYKNKISDHTFKIQELEKEGLRVKKRLEILNCWKEAFSKSGIESMLIDESIPFMNGRVNEYLETLSFGRYVLSFDTVKQLGNKKEYRDKINLNVLDNESLADSRDQFSAGQTRILDIAIILTLCDLQSMTQGIRFNLMLFDEIFDSLDDDNIIRVAKLLRSLTKDRSIYIITHRHIDQIDADDELKL